jgi:hypothetical protein
LKDKPTPDYYNLKQLCEKWDFDLNQLQLAVDQYKIRLWICIKNKKRPFDNENIAVREVKINTLEDSEFFRLSRLSNTQLESEGFTITPLPEPSSFLVKKGAAQFAIAQINGETHTAYPHFNSHAKDVAHDGFLELCSESFMNPKTSVDSLLDPLDKAEVYVLRVKCRRKGYMRFLSKLRE